MSLNVQMIISENKLIGEKMVTPRLVNQQVFDYDAFCDYLAQGSTVTAADVSAVMKQLEKTLPVILALNTKITVSPDGLVFRPAVRGSITQSQLKAKLEQRKAEYLQAGDAAAAAKIDVNRELVAGDLSTSDLTACIVIDLPKKWDARFQQSVTFKRVTKASVAVGEEGATDNDDNTEETPTPPSSTTPKYTLTVKANNDAYGTVEGSGEYAENATATLKATAKNGYEFKQWNDGNTAATRVVTVVADKTYTATFSMKQSDEEGTI